MRKKCRIINSLRALTLTHSFFVRLLNNGWFVHTHTHTDEHSTNNEVSSTSPRWDDLIWSERTNEIAPNWMYDNLSSSSNDHSQVERRHHDKKICKFLTEKFITTFQSNLVNFRYESFDVTIDSLDRFWVKVLLRSKIHTQTHHLKLGFGWLKDVCYFLV